MVFKKGDPRPANSGVNEASPIRPTPLRAKKLERRKNNAPSLLENWIDEAEKRTWFLFEASRN
jgi:hypothetical protein